MESPPDFYPKRHKIQLTAPYSIAATKIAGTKCGSGQLPDFWQPSCRNPQPPYANLYIVLS